jgi:protein required for attachment to host cells
MIKPLNTQFVIADGSRARWVVRSETADDFVTIRELAASAHAVGHPQGVVFEGSSGQRFSVEEGGDAVKKHRAAFAGEIAEAINADVLKNGIDRLAVVAPARTLSAIRDGLSAAASAKLAKTLAKDLTKTPDHELGAWLRRLEMD